MQAVVAAGVDLVDVDAEPAISQDPEPLQIQLTLMPVDWLPPPELSPPFAHAPTSVVLFNIDTNGSCARPWMDLECRAAAT